MQKYHESLLEVDRLKISFKPLGDRGLRIGFLEEISPEVNRLVRTFAYAIIHANIPGEIELIPTYAAISLYYNPLIIGYYELIKHLEQIEKDLTKIDLPPARLIEIPVLYGGEVGPDLEDVAVYHSLNIDQVIELHSARPYLVYMLGFTPGFPYLGGLSDQLAIPRLTNPRTKIPGGSVAIGGNQTGIYSIDAPGGWRIIGHTPVKLYDPENSEPVLLKAGDYLQFTPIEQKEYLQISAQVEVGKYRPVIKKNGE